MGAAGPTRLRFPGRLRLQHAREFDAVRRARVQKRSGPLAVSGRPNGLPHCRLGLSISGRVGNAVVRNRIKRLLREAFRLEQHAMPGGGVGYDLVIAVNPHESPDLAEYRRLLLDLAGGVHREWERRAKKGADAD